MKDHPPTRAGAGPEIQLISVRQFPWLLREGWRDFRAAPLTGLVLVGGFALVGRGLVSCRAGEATLWAAVAATVGLAAVSPFAAAALYDVSRRRERGHAPDTRATLRAAAGDGEGALLVMAGITVMLSLLWLMAVHGLVALYTGTPVFGQSLVLPACLGEGYGFILLALAIAGGALLAFILYLLTAISLPLLFDRGGSASGAMFTSIAVVVFNPVPMLVWACTLAVLLLLAALPGFLGLIVVLPVLGHASWHLYRVTLRHG